MQATNDAIVSILGPLGPVLIVGLLGVLLVLCSLPLLLHRPADPLDKLRVPTTKPVEGKKEQRLREKSRKDQLEKYASFLEPQDAREYSAIKLKLLQAGYKSRNAVRNYHFSQFALGIVGLIVGVIYALPDMGRPDVSGQNIALMILVPGGAGYMLPKYWVTRRQAARIKAIEEGFPDSLDLMLVCVEAGQSLDQSIRRVATELKSGFPDLADEFEILSQELKAGKDKESVLRDMAERCGTPDITSFTTVMIQSAQFGTSIADALRVYAGEMREKRVMKAEEKANKLPTKMTVATMMLTVPPLLLILIGPAVFGMSGVLSGGG